MALRRRIIIEVEDRDFKKHKSDLKEYITESKKGFKVIGDSSVKEGRRVSEGIKNANKELGVFSKLTKNAGGALKGLFLGAAAFIVGSLVGALKRVGAELFEIGSAVGETESKFNTVFGDATNSVTQFVDEFSRISGLTKRQGQDFTSNIGAILQGMGAIQSESAEASKDVVQLAGDLASFNNVSLDDAFGAIRSGITGEAEPLKRFGIILREDEVALRALADTGKKTKAELSDLEKAQARINIIFEKAGVAVGDLERTQNSAANAQRRLVGFITQQREEFAAKLIPAYELLIEYGDDLLRQYKDQADVLGGTLARSIKTIVFDLITFAEQVRATIGAIKEASASFDLSFLGNADKLSFIEQITLELGRLGNIIIGIQRGFVQISLLSAKLQQSVGIDRSDFIEQLEAENQALLDQQVELLSLVDKRRELRDQLNKETGGSGGSGASPTSPVKPDDSATKAFTQQQEEQARKFLQQIERASQLSAAFGKEEKEALENVFSIQDEINSLIEVRSVLGADAVSDELEDAKRRLEVAESSVAKAQAFREAIKEAAKGFEGLSAASVDGPGKLFKDLFKEAEKGIDDILEKTDDGVKIAASALRQIPKATLDEIESLTGKPQGKTKVEVTAEALDDMADAFDSTVRLANVFGDLSDGALNFASSISSGIRELSKLNSLLKETGGSLSLAQGIGSFAGIASAGFSAFSAIASARNAELQEARQRREELKRLNEQLRDNQRAIADNTSALLGESRVGENVSDDQLKSATDLVRGFESDFGSSLRGGNRGRGGSLGDEALVDGFRDFLSSLEDLGIEGFDVSNFENLLQTQLDLGNRPDSVIRDILAQIDAVINQASSGLGDFAPTVDGAIESLRFFSEFLSKDVAEQLDRFLSLLLDGVEGLPDDFRALLEEAQAQDVTTEDGRARINEIIAQVAAAIDAGSFEFGSLSPAEVEKILSQLASLSEAGASGLGADGLSDTTLQIQRTITEVQADAVIKFLSEIAFWAQATAVAVAGGDFTLPSGVSSAVSSGISGPFSGQASSVLATVNNTFNIEITAQGIEQTMTQLERRVRERLTKVF